jgi:hypothetical protein
VRIQHLQAETISTGSQRFERRKVLADESLDSLIKGVTGTAASVQPSAFLNQLGKILLSHAFRRGSG